MNSAVECNVQALFILCDFKQNFIVCLELNSTCWLALKYALLGVVAILAGMIAFEV